MKRNKGFSLMEVCVAMLVISFSLFFIFGIFTTSFGYTTRYKFKNYAMRTALSLMEEIVRRPFFKDGCPIYETDTYLTDYNIYFPTDLYLRNGTFPTDVDPTKEWQQVPASLDISDRFDYRVVTQCPYPSDQPLPGGGWILGNIRMQKVVLQVKGPLNADGSDRVNKSMKLTQEVTLNYFNPILTFDYDIRTGVLRSRF